jgi:S-DNA-T family DNA segregation ATPase FtsK/SpoIIIE
MYASISQSRAPLLIVIDDAELVDDATGALAALISSRVEHVAVVAAGRPDALRTAYGHWTGAVRRSRLGIVMAASSDLDGDLLGVALPRRRPIPARPGLGWLVGDGRARLAQIARSPVSHPFDAPVVRALDELVPTP